MPNNLDIDCIAVGSALIWHPGTWVTGQSAGQVCGEGWVGVVRAGSVFKLSAGIVFANMVRYING